LTERDYTYDSVGNRMTNVVPDPLSGLLTTTYAYGTTSTGPNRLLSTITKDTLNTTIGSRSRFAVTTAPLWGATSLAEPVEASVVGGER